MLFKKEFYKIPNNYLNNPIFADYNKTLKNRIPYKIGVDLENLCNDPDSMILIHRTQLTIPEQINTIGKIFLRGLINNGGNNFHYTLTECSLVPFLLAQLVATFDYKGCKGCIIAKVPRASVGYDGVKSEPIWYIGDDGNYYLIPNYIYGYAHCENGKITELIKNPSYGKKIEIALENRFYDDSALEIDEEVTFSK